MDHLAWPECCFLICAAWLYSDSHTLRSSLDHTHSGAPNWLTWDAPWFKSLAKLLCGMVWWGRGSFLRAGDQQLETRWISYLSNYLLSKDTNASVGIRRSMAGWLSRYPDTLAPSSPLPDPKTISDLQSPLSCHELPP